MLEMFLQFVYQSKTDFKSFDFSCGNPNIMLYGCDVRGTMSDVARPLHRQTVSL